MPTATRAARIRSWAVVLSLMVAEFLLFDRMTSRHHASLYPRWADQIQYLMEAYECDDEARAHGLAAGLKLAVTNPAAQGTLHDIAAVLIFAVAGSASRSAALSLNMLVFLAWQLALWFCIARATGSRVLGWAAFGLVLCLAGPWSDAPGSAVDFRLDHAAMCLFGITGSLALLTDGFRRTGWSVAVGLALSATLLARFLTAVYFVPIFVATVLWILCGSARGPRLLRLLLCAAIAASLAGPVFWFNRAFMLDYYWVGHVTGSESAARAPGLDFAQSVAFIREHLFKGHLGRWFGWTVAGITGALLVLRLWLGRNRTSAAPPRGWLFIGLAFTLSPALVLTFHRQKSNVVVGIIVPGLLLLILWLWDRFWPAPPAFWRRTLATLPAAAAVALGLCYFTRTEITPPHSPDFLRSAREVNALADYIYSSSRTAGLAGPNVGIDRVVDFIDGRILRVICYERHRVWIPFGIHLPDSILPNPDDAVMFNLKYCDYMFLTRPDTDGGYWPYDHQMWRLYPQLKAWCDENLVRVREVNLFGRSITFYARQHLVLPPS